MKRPSLLALVLIAVAASAACARGPALEPRQDEVLRSHSDRLQIAELSVRFADAVNRHDWEAAAELHVEEAIWEASAGKLGFRHEGRAAIRRFLLENPNGVEVLAYTTTTPFIEAISSERARTRVNMMEYLRVRATGEIKRIVGVYSDELVKRNGRWQFARRNFRLQIAFNEKATAL